MTRVLVLPALLIAVAVAGAALLVEPVRAGGGCRGVPSTSAAGMEVRMAGHSCFTPTVLFAETGSTVTWTNDSSEIHDVAGATLEWGNYEEIRAGESVSYRFDKPGTYPYYCFVHNGMIGAIVVGEGRGEMTAARAAGASDVVPVSARSAAESQAVSSGQPQEAVAAAGAAAVTEGSSGGPNDLVFASLGAIAGGVAVAAGFAARGMRRR